MIAQKILTSKANDNATVRSALQFLASGRMDGAATRRWVCEVCGMIHTETRPFSCDSCGSTALTQQSETHREMHSRW